SLTGLVAAGPDGGRALVRAWGTQRDVSARHGAEVALRDSEARFRQIADAMPQLVWTTDPTGYHDYFNERWYAYTGMARPAEQDGAVRELNWHDYLHPDDAVLTFARWSRALATGEPYETEYRLRCAADGAYRWFMGRAEPVRDPAGAVIQWFGTCTDVHDLREAQERLRAKGEQLRLVHRATTDVVWDLDAASGVLAWGPGIADEMGWEDAILGTDLAWWEDKIHPDDRARVAASFEASIEGRGPSWKEEYRFRRADGAYAFVIDRAYVVRDADGAVVRIVGAMVDFSARKAAELELVAAREAAETAARLKSSLLANMSHEIRTPLTAILGYAEMLAGEAPPDLQDLVEPIWRGGKRLMDTLNSVLDLAQLDAGEVSIASDCVDLRAELDEACAALRPLALAKDLTLQVTGAPVWALADRPALARVLANLVGNAVKFTERGAVTVEAGHDEQAAWVRVSDTGVGIAAEFLPALFSEFKQESEGHSRAYEGNGLGLAITKRLAELMGGEIAVESEKGVGSVFTVRLPLATGGARSPREVERDASPLAAACPAEAAEG
ncbi:MAG TPA: PAS domain-containing protein, partial [Rubricoccaceae bacterium]